jgi:hypothetical protein
VIGVRVVAGCGGMGAEGRGGRVGVCVGVWVGGGGEASAGVRRGERGGGGGGEEVGAGLHVD